MEDVEDEAKSGYGQLSSATSCLSRGMTACCLQIAYGKTPVRAGLPKEDQNP